MLSLPIDSLIPALTESLRAQPNLVLRAPPGAGKTTRVPLALHREPWCNGGEIIVLEPRRLAARLSAVRVAAELGERVGDTVGYQVRFDDTTSRMTRIRFVTEGVLCRRLLGDSGLPGVAAVVLDEFHERHLQGDLALALLRRLQRGSRPDLRIVVMSATLQTDPIAAFLDAPVLHAEGRVYPVAIEYQTEPDDRDLPQQVYSAIRKIILEQPEGHVLVFLPGAGEIRKAQALCEKLGEMHNRMVLPLHGDLSPQEQDRAVLAASRPKIILATNVAESSITVDGVVAVVDSGLARTARISPWSGFSTLRIEPVSRASADQRAGRAGRTRSGICVRLYTRRDYDLRPEHDTPEVTRLDYTQTALELIANDAADLEWYESPPAASVRAAMTLLERLGAVTSGGAVTPLGRTMVRLPVHPRQARILVEAERRGVGDDACVLAAILTEGDIRATRKARFDGRARDHDRPTEASDMIAMLDQFREAERARFSPDGIRRLDLDVGAVFAVRKAYEQLRRALTRNTSGPPSTSVDKDLMFALLTGYPDRVARRVRPQGRAIAIAGGGSAELAESSVVRNAPWLVAIDVEERRGGAVRVRTASAIEPDWLLEFGPESVMEVLETSWKPDIEAAQTTLRWLYAGLVLEESIVESAEADTERASQLLAQAALDAELSRFAPEEELHRWIARLRFAASVDATLSAPLAEAEPQALLRRACVGKRSFAELRQTAWLNLLKGGLDPRESARLQSLAPDQIPLPGGVNLRIEYASDRPPWAESYLQDFFGQIRSPKVADGKVPLVIHLLAPNRRAVQVTTDLEGFWDRHYGAIRKELMRKYPRHSWPEDPKTAPPRRRR